MDRRTLLAFLLIFIVFVTFQVANSKFFPPDEIAAVADSTAIDLSPMESSSVAPVEMSQPVEFAEIPTGASVTSAAQALTQAEAAAETRVKVNPPSTNWRSTPAVVASSVGMV